MRVLSYLLLFFFAAGAHASTVAWQADLGEESTWSRVTFAGTLLSASENQLSHYDPESGELLWQRDDLSRLAQFNVRDVAGTPFLVISERLGNVPPKSRLMVLNLTTGETLWDTGELAGMGLGAYPVQEKGLLIYVADLQGQGGNDPGNYVVAFSIDTGEERWRTKLGRMGMLPLHPSELSGFIPTSDLSGHPRPVITDDTMLLAAGDLYSIDLETGAENWRFKLKASNPGLKRTYAQPILADGVIYAIGKGTVHAIDAATGAEKWKTKVDKGPMPQLELVGDKLVGRIGGTFSNGKDLVQAKPFGAFAIDTGAGTLAWKWTKAKDSITNLRVDEERALVLLADKKKLYGLDLSASKKGKVAFDHELEFKRQMGTADIAAKGLGVAGGLLSGGIGGGLKGLAGGGDRGDPPLDIEMIGDQLIVRAQYHVLSHDLETQQPDWSIQFAPPGMNSFALIAMGAVTAGMAAANAAGAYGSSSWSASQAYADSTLMVTDAFQNAAAKRYAAAEKARSTAFFLTKEEDQMVLLGIDLGSGDEVGRIPMEEKEPQFMVDDIGNRVYYFRNKTELLAYDF